MTSEIIGPMTPKSLPQHLRNRHLIQTRLTVPTVSLSQIVYEFGFTDESHLNKFFKNHIGLTPKVYRNLHLENTVLISPIADSIPQIKVAK